MTSLLVDESVVAGSKHEELGNKSIINTYTTLEDLLPFARHTDILAKYSRKSLVTRLLCKTWQHLAYVLMLQLKH